MPVPLRRPQSEGRSLVEFHLHSGTGGSGAPRLVLSLVILSILLLVFNPLDPVRAKLPFVDSFFGAVHGGAASLQQGAAAFFSRILLEDKLIALQNENALLRFALEESSLGSDLESSPASLEHQERAVHPVRIVGLLPEFPSQVLWLRAESAALFEKGAAVLAFSQGEFSLAGRVEQIFGDECYARLLSDPQTSVAVRIEDVGGVFLLEGNAPHPTAPLRLLYATHDLVLAEGQRIYTAPQSDLFPGGLLAGEISRIDPVEEGIFLDVSARPPADPFSASSLFVLGRPAAESEAKMNNASLEAGE